MNIFKKIISFVLAFAVCVSCFVVVSSAEEDKLMGDVNGDGTISIEDAHTVLRMASGIEQENLELADMNGDGFVSLRDAIKVLYEATNIGGVVIPDKTGENKLSDRPDDEFIVLVSEKYNVDKEALVAIYSVPDNGTNYVLQFGNTGTLLNKKYDKSANNLVRVYHIGVAPARKISYTDGKLTGGEHFNCTASEGWLVFRLIKTEVMAQYPTYFK